MPPGTILYRTSNDGRLFGYSDNNLLSIEKGILRDVYAGHAAIYIGKENGEDYVVEAMAGGVVKTPAKYFVNRAAGETFLGARLPSALTPLQQAKAVALAKNLAEENMAYDSDFKNQKGPKSGDWTCVGLIEKIYESADISNPNNLGALEYDPDYYAVDITPDGYDNYSVVNSEGDCLARDREFSKIARRDNMVIPAPELIGFDLGLEKDGERYIFLPYTQFLQTSLVPVAADVEISSSFSSDSVRGPLDAKALALRWSLINNPLSSLKNIAAGFGSLVGRVLSKTKEIAKNLGNRLFSDDSGSSIVLGGDDVYVQPSASKTPAVKGSSSRKTSKTGSRKTDVKEKITTPKVTVNKASSVIKDSISMPDQKKSGQPVPDEPSAVKKAGSAEKASISKGKISKTSVSSASTSYSPTPASFAQSGVSSGPGSSPASDNWPKLARLERIYSTGNNDWVELYNPTDHDFDLAEAGYRLEKTKTSEDPSLVMRLGNTEDGSYPGGTTIKAKGRYLIVRDEANSYYKSKADAIATRDDFNWDASGYTVYLGKDAISSSVDQDIVDAVGFGPDAAYFQGSGPAPEILDANILNRLSSTGNNRTDFGLIPSDDPSALAGVDQTADDLSGTSTTATSTEIAATSTPVTATSTDSASEPDDSQATTTDGIDGADDIATTTPDISPDFALIKKIYGTGNNDWIELFNPTDHDFDLAVSSYRLEKTKTAEDPGLMMRIGNEEDGLYPGGTLIKASSSYLIVRDEADSYYKSKADAIALRDEFSWDNSGYTIYLGNDAISSSTDPDIIGAVGFGPNATYFEGSGPAVPLNDNYILNRIAASGNNIADFNLIASDDPSIVWVPANNATNTSASLLDIFIPPTPIDSAGLTDLWHFDECRGAGEWTVGRFDCAKIIRAGGENISRPLAHPLSLNNLSAGFYYQGTSEYPRIKFSLSGEEETEVNLMLEPGLITVDGLPQSKWRYFMDVPFGPEWHKVNLAINQESDYWALYLDGREIIKETFLANLPSVDHLDLSSDGRAISIDEVSIWNRSLDQAEIISDYVKAGPYSPTVARSPQKPARLIHFWDFIEGLGPVAADTIGHNALHLPSSLWTGRAHDDYAIKTTVGQDISLNFSRSISTDDLSIAFWWRNSSFPGEGRTNISLSDSMSGESKTFTLLANYFRLAYYLDNKYGVLAEGLGKAIPNDGAWHHLALVYDSYRYKLRFYVDGEEAASQFLIGWPSDQTIKRLSISSDGQEAELDDLGIYEGALSPAQIKNIYSNTR